MKQLLLGILLSVFVCNSAYALPFGIALQGDGNLNTPGYIDEINYFSNGVVDLFVQNVNGNTASGIFEQIALIKIGADEFGIFSPEMTIVLNGTGNFTADYSTGSIGDQDFSFTSGMISIYIDDYAATGATTSKWATTDASDGSLYGANDGTLVAEFNISHGSGTLQAEQGQTDNVDIWSFNTTTLLSGYFFFEGLGDFTDVADIAKGIFVQMYTNDTNEILTNPSIIAKLEAEFEENDVMMNESTRTARVYVESEGSAEFTVVPEPATMLLFGIGLLGLAGITRRKKD